MRLDAYDLINQVKGLSGDEKTKQTVISLLYALNDHGYNFTVCDRCGTITDEKYVCRNCGYDDSMIEDDRD